jgi:hypothetical protein
MSFRCGNCNKHARTPVLVMTKIRGKTYPKREYILRGKELTDHGGQGIEAARTSGYCGDCAEGMPRA